MYLTSQFYPTLVLLIPVCLCPLKARPGLHLQVYIQTTLLSTSLPLGSRPQIRYWVELLVSGGYYDPSDVRISKPVSRLLD